MGCSASAEPTPATINTAPRQNGVQQHNRPQQQVNTNVGQEATVPPPHNQQIAPDETDIEVKPIKLDKEVLRRYLELEKLVHKLEVKNVIKNLAVKEEQLADMNIRVQQLDNAYRQAANQAAKEKADVDSVQKFYNGQQDFQQMLSKEQEEYVAAINKQEIAQKEWEGVAKQRDSLADEVASMKIEVELLHKYYKEQDELLAGVFEGKYGSEREYELESELDMLLDRKQRIGVARYKWQNARVLLQHSCTQFSFAVRRWQEVLQVPPQNMQQRFNMVTESRNNLIAANQNVTAAQRYLSNIQFPYCKPEEMVTLTRATNNIYTDMQTQERHSHAYNCYYVTHKRAAALVQWFDNVINGTILRDLKVATEKVSQKERELRNERLILIRNKIKQSGNDEDFDQMSLVASIELDDGGLDDVVVAATMKADGTDGGESGGLAAPGGPARAPTPMAQGELAAAPNQQDLFGDIDDLKRQHEKEMEEFSRAQDINKTRMEAGLQEKLRMRRSKRHRQAAQEEQVAQLG